MQYISPFTILGINGSQSIDKQSVTLTKKKFLAEAELSSSQTVFINGKEMTKNDILNLFDKWSSVSDFEFHIKVAKEKALLDFLESKIYTPKSERFKSDYSHLYQDDDFVEKISPYFAEAYSNAFKNFWKSGTGYELRKFFDEKPDLMMPEDEELANNKICAILTKEENQIEQLSERAENKRIISREQFLPYCNNNNIALLNALPEDEFGWLRDNITFALYNLSASLWNNDAPYDGQDIINALLRINCSERLKDAIEERSATFERLLNEHNASQAAASVDNSSNGFESLWTALRIIFVLIIMARACN